jgi:hypothetical protein
MDGIRGQGPTLDIRRHGSGVHFRRSASTLKRLAYSSR